jgi:PAS domain S-box-containing protein
MNEKNVTSPALELNAERRGRRILCGAALLLLIGGLWAAAIAGRWTDSQMRRELLQQALSIAAAIPAGQAETLVFSAEGAESPEFRRITSQLKTYAPARNIRSLFTLARRDGQLVFGPESLDPDDPYASAPGSVYKKPSELNFQIFKDARPVIQGPYSDEYGTFVSALAPVVNPQTGDVILTIGCDVEASAWTKKIRASQWTVFWLAEIPLMILLAGWILVQYRHRIAPQQSHRLRHTEAATCAIAMLLLTFGAAAVLHQTNRAARRRVFNYVSQIKAESFATQLNSLAASLHGLAAFFESSDSVSWKEFDTYCRNIMQKHPVHGCRWVPAVAPGTEREFEKEIQRTTEFKHFTIWSRDPDRQPAPSAGRRTAYPALYVTPLDAHEDYIGFDLASDPVRFETIQRARESKLATASAPSRPLSDPDAAPGILLCEPARSGNRQGLVTLFFQPETLIKHTAHSPAEGSEALHTDILYFRNGSAPVHLTRHTTSPGCELKLTVPLFLFDQTYAATISPSEEWLAAHPLTYGKITLGIGLILTVLGTSLVSVLANRPRQLRELVRERTRDLRRSEQYIRAIFDSINDAVFVHDADTLAILDANCAAEAMFGMPREQLLQASLEQISSGEPPCTQADAVRRMTAAQAGRPQIFDWRSKRADGSVFWTEISLHAARAGTKHFMIASVRSIEARRQVEEAIRKSEQRFEIAAQAGGIGIWDLDFQTGFLSWDERMHAIYGTRPDEFGCAYTTWQQLLHPADSERISAEVNAARDGQAEYKTQFRIVRPDGEIRHVAASAEVIRAEDGAPLRMIGTNQDITETKRAEAQLRLTQFAVDNLADAAYWIDENGRFIYVNAAACKTLGHTADELLGMCLWDVDPDMTPASWPTILETIKTQKGVTIERTHRRKDNRCFPVEVKISYIEFGETRVICGFAHDISERSEARRRLEESQHFLRTVIDTIPGRVWWKDRDSVFLGCNLNFAKDAGRDEPAKLIGQTDYDTCWKDQADLYIADDQDVIESGLPKLGILEFQTRTDGQVRWLETNKVPLRDADGHIIGTVGTYADITSREQALLELEKSQRFLRTIIDTIPVRIFWKDRNSVYQGCNLAFAQDTGMEHPDHVIGKTDFDIMCSEEHARKYRNDDQAVIQSGIAKLNYEETLITTAGDTAWMTTSKLPLTDSRNNIIGLLGAYENITDRKKAETQIADLARFPQENTNPVLRIARDGTLLYSNAAGNSLLPILGAQVNQPVNGIWAERIERALKAGHPSDVEIQIDAQAFTATLAPVPDRNYVNVYARDITEQKRLREAVERRIIALTRPLESVGDITVEELFDIRNLQKIQDEFAAATGVASIITRPDGTPITRPSNFTEFCRLIRQTDTGLSGCMQSDAAIGRGNPSGPIIQPCLSGGLWDAGAGISVGGRHIANWLIGQVRDETQTEDSIRACARKTGTDEQRLLDAFLKVPAMSRTHFEQISQALFTVATQLSTSAYQNMQQARFISEQKKAEEALRESQEYLEKMWNSMDVGILLIDSETRRVVRANPAVLAMSGYEENELHGRHRHDLLSPDDEGAGPGGKEEPAVERSEHKLVHADGHLVDVEKSVTSITLEGRKVYLETLIDITERKLAEAELLRLSTAIKQSPESVIMTDPDGIIRYVNPAFEATTGYRAEEAIGRVSSFLSGNQESQEFYRNLNDTLREGNVWSGRLSSTRKDGAVRTDESVISPVKDPGGSITHYVAVQRDITDELARESQLQQAQKMEAIGQLAGGIAHDFNNILQAILGFSELLLLTLGEENTAARGNVLEIQKAGLHAADLTRQLLAFSRKQPAEFGPLDLNCVLQDANQILTSIIGENVHLHSHRQPDLVQVNADRRQIERVLINLCINARDAMPDGGELSLSTGNVTFSAEDADRTAQAKAGTFACLSVSDTGTGMAPEIRQHIFEPFFSTKAPGKGTGLGLSAIYGIVQEHRGWINVYSEPGHGSTFKIYLPALPAANAAGNVERPSFPVHSPEGTQRILVVEDDPSVRNLSKMALQKAGYRITIARSAEEAEELFEKENGEFDLLFSDVILPGKNGAELAASIRVIKPDLPVLLCSGYSGDRIRNADIDKKGFHFIEKPFSVVHLLKTVHQIFTSG